MARTPLNVAVQMDHIATLQIAGDTTFALMLEAQTRGHRLMHYTPERLALRGGKVTARAEPVFTTRFCVGLRMHDAASVRSPSTSTMQARQLPSGLYPGFGL